LTGGQRGVGRAASRDHEEFVVRLADNLIRSSDSQDSRPRHENATPPRYR